MSKFLSNKPIIYNILKVISLKDEAYYPKICICFKAETLPENYDKILKTLHEHFKKTDINYEIEEYDPFLRSVNGYGLDFTTISDESFEYNWTIYIFNAKEKFKQSIEWLKKIKSQEKDKEKIKELETYITTHKNSVDNNLALPGKCKIKMEIKINAKQTNCIPDIKENFLDKFPALNKMLYLLDFYNCDINELFTCNYLLFDGNKYQAKKLDTTPITTFIDKNEAKNLGKERIDMYASWFDNSKNGLKRVIVSKENDNIRFYSATNFKINKLTDLLKESYRTSLKMSEIFIEEKSG